MKVVLATPNFHQQRGNTVTVQRIAEKLKHHGVETEIVSITENRKYMSFPQADLVHGFHAYLFYKFKERLHIKIDSYIITITGTDLNHDLFHPGRREDVIASVRDAKAVHVFSEKAKHLLLAEIPDIASKVFVIQQGITEFGESHQAKSKEDGIVQFFFPAGIRKVKNIPFAINALKQLHNEFPFIRLLLAGPIIEPEEGEMVKELIAENSSWAEYIGQVPHSKMGPLYKKADVVLNTSHSEGQSTAIIEAMASGVPVLVSGNDGNLSLVTHDETGYVYREETDFLHLARRLITEEKTRSRLGNRAREHISTNHGKRDEAEALISLYRMALK
ncbi:glycosyl transferase family 1 [Mesobacillus campisalis]|uniref:Glycosyl transferase family 1 n=1 Tax=Mesobacillus campisalis TaxID=1408103 RepID=A0A0M2T039_9BACI|nr:glycosyltransferase family 4 protein [Mesobacillus campisalis]KKK38597.1 glycosyl transferase family 1 [Mesobacillus campisalis]